MKRGFIYCILILSISMLTPLLLPAQDNVDSLYKALQSAEQERLHDSVLIPLMTDLAKALGYSDPDSSIRLCNRALHRAEKVKWKEEEARCYNVLGWCYDAIGQYGLSLENYNTALRIWNNVNNDEGKATAFENMGSVYANSGDYPNALQYYFKAHQLNEKIGDKNRIAVSLGNIGLVHSNKGDDKTALGYYFRALKIFGELKNEYGMHTVLGNIGTSYDILGQKDVALQYHKKALAIAERLNDVGGISDHLGGIGLIYHDRKPAEALPYYNKALALSRENGDRRAVAVWLINTGEINSALGNYTEANKQLQEALEIFRASGDKDGEMEAESELSEVYEKSGDKRMALAHYRRYSALKDSIYNMEKEKAITFREMSHEFDKKQMAEAALHERVMTVVENTTRKQRLIIGVAVSGFVILLLFLVFIFRSLRIARKQKEIIARQKMLVEQKQKEILDSIHYAKRLQSAMLPTEKYIFRNLGKGYSGSSL